MSIRVNSSASAPGTNAFDRSHTALCTTALDRACVDRKVDVWRAISLRRASSIARTRSSIRAITRTDES